MKPRIKRQQDVESYYCAEITCAHHESPKLSTGSGCTIYDDVRECWSIVGHCEGCSRDSKSCAHSCRLDKYDSNVLLCTNFVPKDISLENEADEGMHNDPVHSPNHYLTPGIPETKYIIQAVLEAKGENVTPFQAYCIGNALKYLFRCGRKVGEPATKDLAKARTYLTMIEED